MRITSMSGMATVRSLHLRTSMNVPPSPEHSSAGGTTHATMLNFVSHGAASTVGPYFS